MHDLPLLQTLQRNSQAQSEAWQHYPTNDICDQRCSFNLQWDLPVNDESQWEKQQKKCAKREGRKGGCEIYAPSVSHRSA
jgi:hypothetical protein